MTPINKQLNIDCPSHFIVQGAPKVHDMAPCKCRKMSPPTLDYTVAFRTCPLPTWIISVQDISKRDYVSCFHPCTVFPSLV